MPVPPPCADGIEQRAHGLVVRGELDFSSAAHLRVAASAAYRAGPDERPRAVFVVDMADVTFLDSSGLHVLNEIQRQVTSRAWTLEVVRPRADGPRRLLSFAEAQGWLSG